MASRTDTRERGDTRERSSTSRRKSASERSAFNFGGSGSNTVPLLGALAAGAAIGIGANWARKFVMQTTESMAAGKQWDEILKLEHKATLGKFDLLLCHREQRPGQARNRL